ncbi:hypothetical protein F4861DRAFT_219423 [Xylaria intraflava]|nr:hypothetical protein F4861DRAFT_219423 [Xylaria intraflava]
MASRTLTAGLLALCLLAGQAISETAAANPAMPPAATSPAAAPTSTFISPSRNQPKGGLSESAKIAISISVTLGTIILVGAISILCVVRRRNRERLRTQQRLPDRNDAEAVVFNEEASKSRSDLHAMSASAAALRDAHAHAPDGFAYPAMPDPTYAPGTQQGGYPGVSYMEYQGGSHPQLQQQQYSQQYPQQYPQQHDSIPPPPPPKPEPRTTNLPPPKNLTQRQDHARWLYPVPEQEPPERESPNQEQDRDQDHPPLQDLQFTYLADYQPPAQSNPFYVPPHISELPEQRRVLELSGEGHHYEVP